MSIKSYITIHIIQIIPFSDITQYTIMTIVEHLLDITTILHISEKVTKSSKFNY